MKPKLSVFNVVLIMLLLSLYLNCSHRINPVVNQSVQSPVNERELFKVKLSQKAIELVKEIEAKCGMPIKERYDENITPWAQATIDDEGLPVITAKRGTVMSEELIVHELSHLKMRIKGFSTVYFVGQTTKEISQQEIDELRLYVFDAIEHKMYYPELRRKGFNPDSDRIAEMETVIAGGGFKDESFNNLAKTYFRCGLEVDNPTAMLQFKEFYQKKGWDKAVKRGEELIKIVNDMNPQTSEQEVEAFLQCVNHLYNGFLVFRFVEIEEEQHGLVQKRYAKIQVTPVKNSTMGRYARMS